LPVLPPTRAAVDAMIAAGGADKDFALGMMPPLNRVATIEKLAANAVMAGCMPEYFPVVIAAVKGILNPGFNLDGVQTTTGNVAPVIIVNGHARKNLAINCGANVLGQGWRANATIGRALRLSMTNIGGATPGLFDKATVGQPAKYTFCFGENEEENPWEPLHVERGIGASSSAVSVTGCSGVYSAVDMASQTAKGLLKTFALTMIGGLASGVTSTEVMFVVCPEHAAIFAAEGYSKAAIREELFAAARVPHEKISDENLELLSKRRPIWFQNSAVHQIGAVDRPEDIWIVVAGGAGAKSAYLPGRTGTRMQTVEAGMEKLK
ncbi:MAG TPA: UGSC family (seleno)protein, partial [Terriglobales bacterium]|nr:UGSC family (seleno)protein [Terriglobales bacterium]